MKIAVRIDDITPDMDWESFYHFKEILDTYDIKPLIGVVPDNQDPNLMRDKKREDFWVYIKELQNAGWTIALHGYQHIYTTKKGGIFPLNHFSEFAGVTEDRQKEMLTEGLQIFKSHGVMVDTFMAPGHSYDRNTLRIIAQLGLRYVTDGFGAHPYIEYRSGLTFLPIAFQSKKDMIKPEGYTTLVFHLNGMTKKQMEKYKKLFEVHKNKFMNFEEYKKVAPLPQLAAGRIKERVMANLKYYLVRIRSSIKK